MPLAAARAKGGVVPDVVRAAQPESGRAPLAYISSQELRDTSASRSRGARLGFAPQPAVAMRCRDWCSSRLPVAADAGLGLVVKGIGVVGAARRHRIEVFHLRLLFL